MQLCRVLQSQGFGSRKACRELVRAGRVAVDGRARLNPDEDIPAGGLVLHVDNEAWTYREKAYLVLNKPAGYECSRQPRDHPSVFALLPVPLVARGVQCVGRLDQDTTGLLLLSDDGDFIHHHTSPRRAVGKTYRVTCKHPVEDGMLEKLRDGVLLHDETAHLAARHCVRTGERELEMTIAEGKYHQVKRMVAAAGNRVEALHRSTVGRYELPPDLEPGSWAWLEAADLDRLRAPLAP
ncbi:MAG TPA: 16S rRNA pseudouridine(516) synthase [Thiobacillaceae bacterium]|nr:16S rRNA pseudouridine(516) synthase [Thiobacillaceae bacterium]HNH90019.1 16S rRNA pseudouridine(516) synthase [Thiobacillaceae bacterium]